jgi:hypothetical protein
MSPRANELWAIGDIFAISTMVGPKQPELGCELRASPVVLDPHLHLHFFIRDADADADVRY